MGGHRALAREHNQHWKLKFRSAPNWPQGDFAWFTGSGFAWEVEGEVGGDEVDDGGEVFGRPATMDLPFDGLDDAVERLGGPLL